MFVDEDEILPQSNPQRRKRNMILLPILSARIGEGAKDTKEAEEEPEEMEMSAFFGLFLAGSLSPMLPGIIKHIPVLLLSFLHYFWLMELG